MASIVAQRTRTPRGVGGWVKAKRQARQRAKRRAWIAAEDAAKEEGIYRVEQEIAWVWYQGHEPDYLQPHTIGEIEQYEASRRKKVRAAAKRRGQ